jgi:Protein of unknown function (DUF3800)
MNIYIDESGIFRNPANKTNIASCVGALAIPSSQRREIIKEFKKLIRQWNLGTAEIKGKILGEVQISEVIQMLQQYEVILDLVIMDLGVLTDADITTFKIKSADGITSNLTSEHPPELVAQLNELKQAFLDMANPLFVQAVMLNILVPHLVQNMLTYHSRRIPEELGRFHWVIDAKDKSVTDFEKAWSTAIYPYIYSQSLEHPLYFIEDGDYSYFEESLDLDRPLSKYSREHLKVDEKDVAAFSVKKILRRLDFQDSKTNYGLQLVDILVNATQRALNGKLNISGWGEIGGLMIAEMPQPVRLITFNVRPDDNDIPASDRFKDVINQFKRKSKPMFSGINEPIKRV